MRKDITIEAQSRDTRGKNAARRLRASGLAPAVLYGGEKEPVSITITPKEINKILSSATGHNTIFNLSVANGETTPVMIIDWEHHPVKENLLHIDLKRIDPTKHITVMVPVHLKGESKGVKQQGGLMEVVTRDIEIECLPDDIPADFTVDVTELLIGQYVRAGGMDLGSGIRLVSDKETVICHVVAPKAEAAAEGDAAAEPEVAKKGKKEDPKAATKTATKTAAKTAAPAAKKK
jgi:large subunit ribosomal protein L25